MKILLNPRLYAWLVVLSTWIAAILTYPYRYVSENAGLALPLLGLVIVFSGLGFLFTLFQLWKEVGKVNFLSRVLLLLVAAGVGAAVNYKFIFIHRYSGYPYVSDPVFNFIERYPVYSVLALLGLFILYLPSVRKGRHPLFSLSIESFIFGFAIPSSLYYIFFGLF